MTRERCKCCQRYNPVGFVVPDDIWSAVVPPEFATSVLCIMCFDGFATERGIAWEVQGVEFFPLSVASAQREPCICGWSDSESQSGEPCKASKHRDIPPTSFDHMRSY